MAPPSRSRGPGDPGRRERIITAALTVVGEHGLAGLTHRAVAAQARVPLGSTTYYFATLDDLLEAALDRAIAHFDASLRAWADSLDGASAGRLADALTDLITDYLEERHQAIVEYQVYLAAVSRPRLRRAASRYTEASIDVLSTLTTRSRAVALTAAVDGLLIRGLIDDQPLPRTEIRAALATVLTSEHG